MINDIWYLIKQIDQNLLKEVNRNLETIGLPFSQLRVLVLLRQREKDRLMTSFRDIELNFDISHTTALGLLRRLEAKGFIRTETGHADRRVRNVYLTVTASKVWEILDSNRLKMEKRIINGFTKDEADTLKTLLKKVIRNIS